VPQPGTPKGPGRVTATCRNCGRTIHPRTANVPRENTHGGRGLCDGCYTIGRHHHCLHTYPRGTYSRDELMDKWDHLRRSGHTRREAAGRLGMTWAAFDRAYWRARAAGDPRAVDMAGAA
jgi:hypothetical protein